MYKHHLYILSGSIALIGLVIFAYKILVLHLPLNPKGEQKGWDLEVRIEFTASGGPIKTYLYAPKSDARFAIEDEQFISQGYGLNIRNQDSNRRIIWSVREAKGRQVLFYRATVRPAIAAYSNTKPLIKTPKLIEITFTEAELISAQALLTDVLHHSADTESLVLELLKKLNSVNSNSPDEHAKALLGIDTSLGNRLQIASQILALQGISARVMHGIWLVPFSRNVQLVSWLEVYHNIRWNPYDPVSGNNRIPDNYLAWWHGENQLATVKNAHHLKTTIAILEKPESILRVGGIKGVGSKPLLYKFSLLNLPVDTQAVYKILMTLPLGVLLLVVLRNVIGLKTFGTFMPVLIAISFRETQLVWGLFHFVLIVSIGLGIRFYLGHLRLLLVPRLATILILVIMVMASMSIFSNQFGLHQGLSVALFPMVIITMTIERMSIVWDERGPPDAIKQGLGSLLAASLAYLVMTIPLVEHLLFVFPELILEILAVTLLLGRYTGYRLLELSRFKALAKQGRTPSP
jgi:hypothetical protein